VFDFEDLGPRPVKGRTEPVQVYRVAGRRPPSRTRPAGDCSVATKSWPSS
jgi:class 3 adenylate cyclase